MKTAILSDIHANLEALTRCCEHALGLGVDRFACLGDCVGYCADPEACVRMLMSLPGLIAVRGNHDDVLFQEGSVDAPAGVRAAIPWTLAQLRPEQRRFLSDLPLIHRESSATYVHASAHAPDKWEYLRMPDQILACIEASERPVTFIGHVHVPKVYYETPAGDIRELDPHSGVPVPLSPHSRYVVSVGAVGQPRDGNNASCYVVFDDVAREVTFYRLAYDFLGTGRKILAAHIDPCFAERLARGR